MLVVAALAWVLLLFALNLRAPPFSPDSWGYLELARSFAADPYAVVTWRAFATTADHSSAFPPLWPLLLAAADRPGGLGLYAGAALALAFFFATVAVVEQAVRQAFGRRWLGAASVLLLFAYPPFQLELLAARAVPLQLMLLALVLHLLVVDRWHPLLRAVLLGTLAGLLLMARFDALFLAAGLVLATPFVLRDWRALPLAAAALLLVVAPWIAYSAAQFGQVFATDNAAVALSLDPRAHVADFVPRPQPQLGDAPLAWAWKLVQHLPGLAAGIAQAALYALPATVLIGVAAHRIGLGALCRAALDADRWRTPRGRLALLALACALPIGAYLITGYYDARYFSALVWVLALLALLVLAEAPRARDRGLLLACALLGLLTSLEPAARGIRHGGEALAARPLFALDRRQVDGADLAPLLACREPADAAAALLFATPTQAARFGALTGQRATFLPRNWTRLDAADQREFLRRYGVRWALADAAPALPPDAVRAIDGDCGTRLVAVLP